MAEDSQPVESVRGGRVGATAKIRKLCAIARIAMTGTIGGLGTDYLSCGVRAAVWTAERGTQPPHR
jgi:hypothetical protein